MAQLVEQFIRNEQVPGSSPGFGSNEKYNKDVKGIRINIDVCPFL